MDKRPENNALRYFTFFQPAIMLLLHSFFQKDESFQGIDNWILVVSLLLYYLGFCVRMLDNSGIIKLHTVKGLRNTETRKLHALKDS